MSKYLKNIMFDCERMKYPNTGLYHFCLELGKALVQQINADEETINFYIRESEIGVFGDVSKYVAQHALHKFYMPTSKCLDVWHTTYQGSMYYPVRGKMKKVLTIHDINFMHDTAKSAEKKAKYLAQLQKKNDGAAHITTISQFVLNDVKQYINLDNKPTTVIYNGCNIANITNVFAPNYQPQHPFLFTIGTVTDKKNFHVLPCLLANNNQFLVIAGIVQSEAYKQKIIAEAEKYNVADRVIFTGPISENDKQWYYQNCEAFVFPSLAEGFGLPVIEAMYFGKPTILSTATSLPEIGGKEAYYFNSFSPENMQQTLAESLQHYQATNPSESIKQRAAMFSWQKAAQQYLAVYRSLY